MMSNVHIITNYNVNANHAFIKPVDKPGSQHPVQGSDECDWLFSVPGRWLTFFKYLTIIRAARIQKKA